MPAKTNPADRVLQYFQTAPLSEAVLLLELVKGTVKRRKPAPPVKVRTCSIPSDPLRG